MGDRAQVRFIDEVEQEVWFYTHGRGYCLEKTVNDAMKKGADRHNDSEYLARIIFCEMVKDAHSSTTGFGIGFGQNGDVDSVVIVDCKHQKVTYFDGEIVDFNSFKGV